MNEIITKKVTIRCKIKYRRKQKMHFPFFFVYNISEDLLLKKKIDNLRGFFFFANFLIFQYLDNKTFIIFVKIIFLLVLCKKLLGHFFR